MYCNIGNFMMGNLTWKGGRVVSRCKEKEVNQSPFTFDVVMLGLSVVGQICYSKLTCSC